MLCGGNPKLVEGGPLSGSPPASSQYILHAPPAAGAFGARETSASPLARFARTTARYDAADYAAGYVAGNALGYAAGCTADAPHYPADWVAAEALAPRPARYVPAEGDPVRQVPFTPKCTAPFT